MRVECFPDAPLEWERKTVHEIARVSPRYRLKKDQEYPFVEMAAVAENFGGITRFDFRQADASGLARFRENDILFGKITPCAENGKVALVKGLPGEYGLGSTEFIVLSPREGNDPRFVYALVSASSVHGRAVTRMEGSTGRQRITEDTFTKLLEVPVPLFDEQVAIADILESVDESIKRTRTALEKARKVRKGVIQKFLESGIGKVSSADAPSGFLRKGWRLEQTRHLLVGDPKNGISPVAAFQPPGYPTFSIAAVRQGKIDLSSGKHLKYVQISEAKAEEFAVKQGDLLIVRGNANPELVGLCGMVADHPDKCVYPDILKRVVFRDDEQGCLPAYVRIVWNHPVIHNQVLKRAKTSNGTLKINSKDVKQIVLPVPPKPEQEDFVNLVDALDVQLDSLEDEVTSLQKLKRGLMQDLLTGKVRVKQLATAESAGD